MQTDTAKQSNACIVFHWKQMVSIKHDRQLYDIQYYRCMNTAQIIIIMC